MISKPKKLYLKKYNKEEYAFLHIQSWKLLNPNYYKNWQDAHPNYFCIKCKIWRVSNKEHIKEYRKSWISLNPVYYKKYRIKNLEKLRNYERKHKRKIRSIH